MHSFKKIKQKKKKSLLFYDYETFGIHVSLDKPAQFSCIRTDMDFNIIHNPEVFYCYPPYDYLPNPKTILLTGITPNFTLSKGLNEFFFAKKINAIFSISNTCILGYNNIHFDDEITRNIFYRNLINPYDWTFKNSNSRWDVLNVLRAYYALRPEGINWPLNENKVVTFKLNEISKANGIQHINAHDATSDVYATIELIKLLKEKQPKLLNFLFKYRIKSRILTLFNITDMEPIFYISSSFGILRYNISLIAPIMWHPNNSNILISVDLMQDLSLLKQINIDNIFSMGIIKLIHINKCPILIPYPFVKKYELLRLGINLHYCHNNFLLLKNYNFLKEKITEILCSYTYIKSNNIDLKMYDAFFNNQDQFFIKKTHESFPVPYFKKKYKLHDKRIKEIIFRCKARNFITFLKKYEKILWFEHCMNTLNNVKLNSYKCNIQSLIKKNINSKKNVLLLQDLLNYIDYLQHAIIHIL